MSAGEVPLTATTHRFGRVIERRDGVDFPYYDASPIGISTGRWAAVCLACLVAYLVLTASPESGVVSFVAQLAFTAIMLGALAWAVGRYWTAVFGRVRCVTSA